MPSSLEFKGQVFPEATGNPSKPSGRNLRPVIKAWWYLSLGDDQKNNFIKYLRENEGTSLLWTILVFYTAIFLPVALASLGESDNWLGAIATAATGCLLILPGYLVLYLKSWQLWVSGGSAGVRRIPPKIFTVLKQSELAFEIIFIIGAVISQALQLFARIYGGPCISSATKLNSSFCNPEFYSNALPQDTAFALILLPGLLRSAVKTSSADAVIISWVLSFATLIAAIGYADAWHASSVLILFSFVETVRMLSSHQQYARLYVSTGTIQEELYLAKKEQQQTQAQHHSMQSDLLLKTPANDTPFGAGGTKPPAPTAEAAEKAIQMQTLLANLDEYLLSPLNSLSTNAEQMGNAIRSVISILRKIEPPPKKGDVTPGNEGEESKSVRLAASADPTTIATESLTEGELEIRHKCRAALSQLTPCNKMLDHIMTSARFMIATVNNKLVHTKTRQAPTLLVPQFRTVNILDAVDWCISCLQNKDESAHEFIVRDLPENVFPYIITDGQWLNENLLCVLANAMKNSFGGPIEVSIKLVLQSKQCSFSRMPSAQPSRNNSGRKKPSQPTIPLELIERLVPQSMLRFDVYDGGIGIDPEIMRKVFLSPMERGKWAAKIKGVGLYNLSRRVDAVGGACGIAPRPDGRDGTGCWFSEPYRPDLNPMMPHSSSGDVGLDTIGEEEAADRGESV